MNIFSRINSVFLAAAVVLTTFGQLQTLPVGGQVLTHSNETQTPAYSGVTSQNIWAVINLDGSSFLFNVFSNSDSEEDRTNSSKSVTDRESSLAKISSLYFLVARHIALSPSVSDLLYPFHFYF